jgi:transketolase
MVDETELKSIAVSMRRNILNLAYSAGNNGAHIAPALSIVEIMAVIYFCAMNRANRDAFVLSKGHGALAYYVSLFEAGIITYEQLTTYEENGGNLPGQPSKLAAWGIDYSGGSLGMGLAYGCGLALSNIMRGKQNKVFVLMGDGELNEGTVWESAFFAAHNRLSNLVAVVDKNSMQSDGYTSDILKMDIESLWQSSGWNVVVCNGHDFAALKQAFAALSDEKPTVIVAETTKGKGVSFMENNKEWHHNRLSEKQLNEALRELEVAVC